jgi:hypothetical protein
LFLSELNERILKGVLGHHRPIELETLVLAGDLLERLDLILESVHLPIDVTLLKLVLLLEELVYLLHVVFLCGLQDLQCGVLLGLRVQRVLPLLIVHVIDLLVDLDLCLGLQGVEEFLLLSVLLELVNVPVESAADPEAHAETQDGDLVHVHEVEGALDSSHLIYYYNHN